MRTLLAVLMALALTGLSGCLAGDGTITAKDGLGPASDAAQDLVDATPRLIGVASFEPFREYIVDEPDEDLEVHLYLDDDPGDGLAPGWVYLFTAGDDMVAIGYASGLGVLFTVREGGNDDASEAAITGWNTDSDDAARALKEHPEWPTPDDSSTLFWELVQEGDCPIWTVEQEQMSDPGSSNFTTARVDGCTGEVLDVSQGDRGLRCVEGTSFGGGTATPLSEAGSYWVTLEAPGTVQYSVDYHLGAGLAHWTLTGPEGVVAEGTSDADDVLEGLPAGEYTLTIDAAPGVWQVDVSLTGWFCE